MIGNGVTGVNEVLLAKPAARRHTLAGRDYWSTAKNAE
jgi:hypothetical protein